MIIFEFKNKFDKGKLQKELITVKQFNTVIQCIVHGMKS